MSILILRAREGWRDHKPFRYHELIGRYYGVPPTAVITSDGQEKHLRRDPLFEPLNHHGGRRDLAPGVRYRCSIEECGHECTTADMGADFVGGEAWSNWICPSCGSWQRAEDWEAIPPL